MGEWEARKEVERAAKNKLLNLRKQKMKTARGAGTTDTRNADAKLADNEALKLAYKKATGTKNVEVYQIKNKIKEAAVESDDMRAVMEAATTEADTKEAVKPNCLKPLNFVPKLLIKKKLLWHRKKDEI